jgi:hypothetical protein
MNYELPHWTVRLNGTRPTSDYADLLSVVSHHFRTYTDAEAFLGPYNARQRSAKIYTPPDREQLRAAIKQGGMNDITYAAFMSSIIRFCENSKGQRALPTPHPSTIHSIQLSDAAFEIKSTDKRGAFDLIIPNCAPITVQGLRNPEQIKFVIVRPKLSGLGTPSVKNWEVLFFNSNLGYIPYWTDTQLNPRYSGLI